MSVVRQGDEADVHWEVDRSDVTARSESQRLQMPKWGSARSKRNWHSMAYVRSDWAFANMVKGARKRKSSAEEGALLDKRVKT